MRTETIGEAVYLDGKVQLLAGDCRDVLATLPDCSVDAIVTDPPYGLLFMGRAWDAADGAPFAVELWAQALRVLKPGGHLAAFGGTRMYHRLVVAIEDAGFEIRDAIMWHYGSGFPKSLDVSKAIDKAAGAEREVVGFRTSPDGREYAKEGATQKGIAASNWEGGICQSGNSLGKLSVTAPATDDARRWQGWGTALKPSTEIICLARKPLIGTVAANVLAHGTGALNIDGCRVGTESTQRDTGTKALGRMNDDAWAARSVIGGSESGRWPANLCHDGSPEVVAGFPETTSLGERPARRSDVGFHGGGSGTTGDRVVLDGGSAARFFYTAKADAEDRLGSKHPTVKPVDLMQWLVRLVCPKGGVVLDPFAGTGTTGEAAWREGMRAILIEREEEYREDIARRMELAVNPTKRAAVAATKNNLDDPNSLPLFAGAAE